jgi:hypothetical protein
MHPGARAEEQTKEATQNFDHNSDFFTSTSTSNLHEPSDSHPLRRPQDHQGDRDIDNIDIEIMTC